MKSGNEVATVSYVRRKFRSIYTSRKVHSIYIRRKAHAIVGCGEHWAGVEADISGRTHQGESACLPVGQGPRSGVEWKVRYVKG